MKVNKKRLLITNILPIVSIGTIAITTTSLVGCSCTEKFVLKNCVMNYADTSFATGKIDATGSPETATNENKTTTLTLSLKSIDTVDLYCNVIVMDGDVEVGRNPCQLISKDITETTITLDWSKINDKDTLSVKIINKYVVFDSFKTNYIDIETDKKLPTSIVTTNDAVAGGVKIGKDQSGTLDLDPSSLGKSEIVFSKGSWTQPYIRPSNYSSTFEKQVRVYLDSNYPIDNNFKHYFNITKEYIRIDVDNENGARVMSLQIRFDGLKTNFLTKELSEGQWTIINDIEVKYTF